MKITNGQNNDIKAVFPWYNREKSSIIAEAGNDDGKTFRGDFVVRLYRLGVYRFTNGKAVKKVA